MSPFKIQWGFIEFKPMSSWLLAPIRISNISSTCRNDVIRFLWESYVARWASSQLWAGQAPNCHSHPLSPSQLENPQGSQSQGVDPTTRTTRKSPQQMRFSVPSTQPLSNSHSTYHPQDRYLKSQKKVLKIAWPWPDGHICLCWLHVNLRQPLCVYDYVNSAKTYIYVDFCVCMNMLILLKPTSTSTFVCIPKTIHS